MKKATAGAETTKIDIPVTHRDIFYNLPIKIMCPFKNATALNNTICMLSDPQVNHPTYQMGELEPLEERVHATVSRFLCQAVHEQIMIPREQS